MAHWCACICPYPSVMLPSLSALVSADFHPHACMTGACAEDARVLYEGLLSLSLTMAVVLVLHRTRKGCHAV